jgi:hypothetical protein
MLNTIRDIGAKCACSLWSRLIIHFWALEIEKGEAAADSRGEKYEPHPTEYLQHAYEKTIEATSKPNQWQGTTTASGAQLHFEIRDGEGEQSEKPVLYITNLGDSRIMVIRPSEGKVIFKTVEQWHWFDCPRQLGTNSPDTPKDNAVTDKVELEEDDIVLAVSDGVIDNLWEHEIVENVMKSIKDWENNGDIHAKSRKSGADGGMKYVAEQLMLAAKTIAQDPFAESPFMEHAVEEGLAMEGGKMCPCHVILHGSH